MVCVTQSYCQCVCLICIECLMQANQKFHHVLYLNFVRVTLTGDSAFDLCRRVLEYR